MILSNLLTLCEEYLPCINPVWSLSITEGRTFSSLEAKTFARSFKSKFKTDIGLYDDADLLF